ncbi:abortive infection protein [Paenibacillus sp. FSL R7-0273]|uniref:CPBP family intramembrane glutamic endopeptidase n=1 Tax=Paenibacillus sp. FSL R7-0273 TaxID=1536772 RepID=UPI0004F8A281|nr:CPBP family intramembrane glutamic endopeptidase [Paenibacillus sp. FSL R7-0273]AIQ48483.1 abortive infection protein [Paenibacillus sp. FSL R7-0273]OMF86304.1 CAAX protease family protein [Paenibacillus sp. FSL R7-0273]
MDNIKQIRSIGMLIWLHVLPGALLGLLYILLLKAEILSEYPRIITLGLAGVISIVPIQWGCLLYVARKETGSFNIFRILGLKSKLEGKSYFLYTAVLLVLTGVLMLALSPLSGYLLNTVFSWIPHGFNYNQDMSTFSRNEILLTIAVSFFFFTLIGPVTEELYFRGFLLARMNWLGNYGVLLNLILFAVYHVWSPWLIIARIVAFLPLFYIVRKKDSYKLGITVHCLANFSDVIGMVMLL